MRIYPPLARLACKPMAPIPRAAPARPNPARGTRPDAIPARFARLSVVPAVVASEGMAMLSS